MNQDEKRPEDQEDEASGSANTLPAAPDDDDDSALGDTDQHSDAAA
jgi:hypothetical protein